VGVVRSFHNFVLHKFADDLVLVAVSLFTKTKVKHSATEAVTA
jgi:hypothetical protein